MAQLIFKRGSLANLNNLAVKDGQFIVTTDEGALYVDNGSTRVRLGDFIVVENVAALPSTGANRKAMYYCESENVLARWNGTEWKQINKQPTNAELKVALGLDAEGVVTAAIAAAKKAGDDAQLDVDNLENYVGTFTHDTAKTVVEYINAKTDGIATSGNLEALGQRVTTVEGKVATIEGDYLKGADKTELEGKITAAQTAGDNAQAHSEGVAKDLDDHEKDAVAHITAAEREAWNDKTTMAEVEAKNYLVAADISGKADSTQVATDIAAAVKTETDNRVAADEAIEAKIGEVAEGKTVVKMIEEAQTAATYNDTEVRGLISDNAADIKAIADDYLKGSDKTELEGKIGEKVAQTAYDTKVAALEGEDARLAGLISAMDKAYKEADTGLSGRIAALESDITGLSGAMHFKGVVDALPESTDGYKDGDTIIVGNKEYVVNGEAFVELGDVSAEVQRISDLEAVVNGTGEGEAHVDGLVDQVADNAAAIVTEKERAEAKEAELVKADADNLAEAKKYTDDEIAELNISQYAKNDDLELAKGRITTAEGKITALETASATHALKTEVEAVSKELGDYKTAHASDYTNEQIDAAVKVVADDLKAYEEAHASDYTNEQINNAIANAGHASAQDLANHIADTVSHVTAEDKVKWNAAEQNAKDYSDGKLATARTEISAEIDADVKAEADRAKGVEGGLQSAIDTHTNNGDIHVTAADKEKWNKAQENAEKTASDALTAALTWGEF